MLLSFGQRNGCTTTHRQSKHAVIVVCVVTVPYRVTTVDDAQLVYQFLRIVEGFTLWNRIKHMNSTIMTLA